ncbi:MAG: hypothetical protein KF773_22430 [Deltaproteobacteria bacterium]|nr:hypothetical protein [Deltaproteobacteria bacterium]MCW5805591.1 hypothetical protein [Deltaproteobacteria bacterium]
MGANAGFLKKFDGLQMEADIVSNDLGPANIQKKHVANIKWTPAKATIGIGMGKEMYQIIKDAFDAKHKPFDGALHVADFNHKVQSSLNFTGGIMTEVTIPKMDGGSKDAAYFDVSWEAETVRWLKGDNSDIRGKIAPKQKAWLCSNFRFEMGGLPCSRVATIDSFTWKCGVTPDQIGIVREPTKHAAKVTIPDITVEVSMADYDAWAQAAKKWFVDGAHEEKDEMTGAIVFLNPNMKDEIGRITLENCGFKSFSRGALEANKEGIARFKVAFYCESMKFEINYADSAK